MVQSVLVPLTLNIIRRCPAVVKQVAEVQAKAGSRNDHEITDGGLGVETGRGEQAVVTREVGETLFVHHPRFKLMHRQDRRNGLPVVGDGIVVCTLGDEVANEVVYAASTDAKVQPPCGAVGRNPGRFHSVALPFCAFTARQT